MASLLCRSPRSAAEWRYFFTVKRASLLTPRRMILARLPSSSSSLFRVSLASALASLSLSHSVFSSLFLFFPFFSSFLLPPLLLSLSFSLSFFSLLLFSSFFSNKTPKTCSRLVSTPRDEERGLSPVIQNREKRPESVNFTPLGASGRRYSGHNLHPAVFFRERLDLRHGQDPVKNLPLSLRHREFFSFPPSPSPYLRNTRDFLSAYAIKRALVPPRG